MSDPYLYPGTNTLKNYFNIKDPEALQELESAYYYINLNKPFPEGGFDYDHLKAVHKHLFGDVYPWAGQERSVDISKGSSCFGHTQFLSKALDKIFINLKKDNHLQGLEKPDFCSKLAYYFNEINAAHPFREGNGRTLRLFCEHLSLNAGYKLQWQNADAAKYLNASITGFQGDNGPLTALLNKLVIPKDLKISTADNQTRTPLSYAELLLSQEQQRSQDEPKSAVKKNRLGRSGKIKK